MPPNKQKRDKEILALAESGGTDKELVILDKIHELEDKVAELLPDVKSIISKVRGDNGTDGVDGEQGLQGSQGLKGDTGPQGVNGKDGKSGRDGRDGRDGVDGRDGLNGTPDSSDEIRDKLELLQGEDRLDKSAIKGLEDLEKKVNSPQRVNSTPVGFRAYVSGTKKGLFQAVDFKAGSNITITHSVVGGLDTLTFASSGSSFLAATGTVNGSNTSFTFTSAPSVIIVDQGRAMQKVSSDGTVNWSGTTTVTLTVAPNFDIYGQG